jgi:hypothetical protein
VKELLHAISIKALAQGKIPFTEQQFNAQWLGETPASRSAIVRCEDKLKLQLPTDYIEFLHCSNGFVSTSDIHTSFLPIEDVDYFEVKDKALVDFWVAKEPEIGLQLQRSILIAGLSEDQQLLLVPPHENEGWHYWQFAAWIPGIVSFENLSAILNDQLAFLEQEPEDLECMKAATQIDYALKNAVFEQNWEAIYTLSKKYIATKKLYPYFKAIELEQLMLLSSSTLGRNTDYQTYLIERIQATASLRELEILDSLFRASETDELFLPNETDELSAYPRLVDARDYIQAGYFEKAKVEIMRYMNEATYAFVPFLNETIFPYVTKLEVNESDLD